MPTEDISNTVEAFKVPVCQSLTSHYTNVRKRLLAPQKPIKTIDCEFCGSKNVPVINIPPHVTIRKIIKFVSRREKVLVTDMLAHRRFAEAVGARQIAMYLAKRLTNHSLPTIGNVFKRDHTTVMHAVWKIEGRLVDNPAFAKKISAYAYELGDNQIPFMPDGNDSGGMDSMHNHGARS